MKIKIFNKAFLGCIFILLLFNINSYAQTDDSLYYTNPDLHVAKELFNRKIVMLGETGHHQPGNYRYLLNTLENWLILCNEKDSSINLSLILELDEIDANGINTYIRNGDFTSYFEKFTPQFYLEDIEFTLNLRKFYLKADSINKLRQNKINFTIKGFEDVGVMNYEKVAKMTLREHSSWYVNEQDSIAANGIINYMNSNPSEQILIFYGASRILDGYHNKHQSTPDLKESKSIGYYLTYYLRKEFGKSNVLTIYNDPYFEHYFSNVPFKIDWEKDFLIKSDKIEKSLLKYAEYVDYIYSYNTCWIVFPIFGKFICSRLIYQKELNELIKLRNYQSFEKGKSLYTPYLFIIQFLCGISTQDTNDIIYKLSNANVDPTDWLYSNKLMDSLLIPKFDKNHRESFLYIILSSYGIKNNFNYTDSSQIDNYENWKVNELPKIYEQIKFTNSIGIYWLGYPDEKIKAKEYLKQFSGEDYNEPEKYLKWYRIKYFGCEY